MQTPGVPLRALGARTILGGDGSASPEQEVGFQDLRSSRRRKSTGGPVGHRRLLVTRPVPLIVQHDHDSRAAVPCLAPRENRLSACTSSLSVPTWEAPAPTPTKPCRCAKAWHGSWVAAIVMSMSDLVTMERSGKELPSPIANEP